MTAYGICLSFLFWLRHTACGTLSSMVGDQTQAVAVKVQNPNHQVTRELPFSFPFWLISLCTIISGSNYVATNAIISFFFIRLLHFEYRTTRYYSNTSLNDSVWVCVCCFTLVPRCLPFLGLNCITQSSLLCLENLREIYKPVFLLCTE